MTWIQTYTGECIDFDDIENAKICIEDIAHALSLQCRFNGHCTKFYSIAEHSIYVAERVAQNWGDSHDYPASNKLAKFAFLHDAAEAYVGDMVAPLKLYLSGFVQIERRFRARIEQVLVGDKSFVIEKNTIRHADLELLATERDQIMVKPPKEWIPLPDPIDIELKCYSPSEAEWAFLQKANVLGLLGESE